MNTYHSAEHSITNLHPGDHVCCLCGKKELIPDLLVGFINAGLGLGQKVLLLVHAWQPDALLAMLEAQGIPASALHTGGQLELQPVFPPEELPDANTGAERFANLPARINTAVEKALAEGYPLLRACLDMSWAASPGGQRGPGNLAGPAHLALEHELSCLPLSGQLALVCLYDRSVFAAPQLLPALRTHPWLAAGPNLIRNYFYQPAETSPGSDPATALIEASLDILAEASAYHHAWPKTHAAREKAGDGNFYKTIFDSISDPIYVHDFDGRVLEVNRAACERLGYSYDEILHLSAADIDTTEEAAQINARIDLLRRQGHITFETIHRTRLGDAIPQEVRAHVVNYRGKPVIFSIARDITARRLAQHAHLEANQALAAANQALRASEARFRLLFDNSPDGIILSGADGLVNAFSRAAEAILGLPAAEVFGQPVLDVLAARLCRLEDAPDPDFPDSAALCQMQAGSASPWLFTPRLYRCCRGDGLERFIQVMHYPVPAESGSSLGTNLRDVTEQYRARLELETYQAHLESMVRERTEELEREVQDRKRSLAEKEVMLREIHHRVKNNLSVIIALINLQDGTNPNPATSQIFKDLQARVYSMALVHEALYRTPNLAQVNFGDYLHTLTAYLHQVYTRPGSPDPGQLVQLRVEAADIFLKIDAAIPCGLIVNELVTNALKYAFPPGFQPAGVAPTILVRLAKEGEQVVIHVIDNGAGFQENLNWRTGQTLGLQIVQVLAHQLRARLDLLEYRAGVDWALAFVEAKEK